MSLLLNYLKSALRNIARLRVHAIVNITGLTIGFAGFIIIMLYVSDEISYDKYHTHADEIVRVLSTSDFEGVAERSVSCPAPLGPAILLEYPHLIAGMTRIYNDWSTEYYIEYEKTGFREKRFFFVDSTFSDVFDLHFLQGIPGDALSKPFTAIITKTTAVRYFGNEDPVGKTIKFEGRINIMITGVIADTPPQSHFSYDFLASMSTLRMLWGGKMPETWVYNPFWTYLRLHDKDKAPLLAAQLPAFTRKYFYDAEKDHITLSLQPLTDIHLRSDLDYEIEPNGKISYVRILVIVALFILIIAVINYINLSTAFAIRRSRETAIRKVAGASRQQLIIQHLGESFLLTFIALVLSLAVIEIILPFFNHYAGKEISSSVIYTAHFLPKVLLLWLGTGLLSGLYPAIFQSGFKTLQVLKGRSTRNSSGFARKALVITQFTLSIALITSSMMAFEQISYLRKAELGFRKENIIIVPVMRSPVVARYDAFRDELSASPGIDGVTAVDYIIGTDHNNHEFRPEGYPPDKWQFYPALVVRDDFCKVFDIEIVAGRDFIKGSKTDPMEAILINEAMVKHLGWKSNEEALGKRFHSRIGKEKVVGVFRSFNASSLHSKAGPLVLNVKEEPWEIAAFTNFIAVRAAKGKSREALESIEKMWENYAPGRPFSYTFLSNELDKLYKEEEYLSQVSAVLAVLTILIAAIGLFGLVSFMATQKMHEIGIRKVLGASTSDLILVLTSGYIKLVAISILIAWPLSYFVIDRWFDHFAYRADIRWGYFLLAGVLSLLLTITITGIKAWRSSEINPAITLKYE
ncbi:ABC transporter permease [Lentimicrobium sp.]|uniref:ABC transporter permease n=1 Tax=Lentimicrobium sp. TaxID=2034841 RepID=UPI00345EA63B